MLDQEWIGMGEKEKARSWGGYGRKKEGGGMHVCFIRSGFVKVWMRVRHVIFSLAFDCCVGWDVACLPFWWFGVFLLFDSASDMAG